jgi:hypothetical protein
MKIKYLQISQEARKICKLKETADDKFINFNGFLTVHHSVDLNLSPT